MNQVWAVFIVGFVAAVIAIWGVQTQRAIARRRATLDHISRGELDEDLIKAHNLFIKLAKTDGGLAKWADETHQATDQVQAIKTVCNDQELISIGIHCGIIDFRLYVLWNRSGVLRRWQYAEPFVKALRDRTNNQTLYHEFEQMADWMKKEPMPKRGRWRGQYFW
jgi:hypothetical protein